MSSYQIYHITNHELEQVQLVLEEALNLTRAVTQTGVSLGGKVDGFSGGAADDIERTLRMISRVLGTDVPK